MRELAAVLAPYDSTLGVFFESEVNGKIDQQAKEGGYLPPEPPASENVYEWKMLTEEHPEQIGHNPWLLREAERTRLRTLALQYEIELAAVYITALQDDDRFDSVRVALEQHESAFREQHHLNFTENMVLFAREFTAPTAKARAAVLARHTLEEEAGREAMLCREQAQLIALRLYHFFHPTLNGKARSLDDPNQHQNNLVLAADVVTEEVLRVTERGVRNAYAPMLAAQGIIQAAERLKSVFLLQLFDKLEMNGQPLAAYPELQKQQQRCIKKLLLQRVEHRHQAQRQRLENQQAALWRLPLLALERAENPTPLTEHELQMFSQQGLVPHALHKEFMTAVCGLQKHTISIELSESGLWHGYNTLRTAIQAGWASVGVMLRVFVFGSLRARYLLRLYKASLEPMGKLLAVFTANGAQEAGRIGCFAAEQQYITRFGLGWNTLMKQYSKQQANEDACEDIFESFHTDADLRHIHDDVLKSLYEDLNQFISQEEDFSLHTSFRGNACNPWRKRNEALLVQDVYQSLQLPVPLPRPEPVIDGVSLSVEQYQRLLTLFHEVKLEEKTVMQALETLMEEKHLLCIEHYTLVAEERLKAEDTTLLQDIIDHQCRKQTDRINNYPESA